MDLSIVIVNWNTRESLETCLRSIAARSGALDIQIIVVDNQSSDGSSEMVSRNFPGVCLVNSGGNIGFARGCNLGLTRATAPLVLFLNPDTEIIGDALEQMVAFMRSHAAVAALNCKIRELSGAAFGPGLQWFPSPLTELARLFLVSQETERGLGAFLPYQDPSTSGFVKKLYGGCLLVQKQAFEAVGAFDERFFMYCEDVDLSRRLTNAGWKLYYLSEVEVFHLGGGASSRAPGRFSVLMMCESFSKLMHKYHGWGGSLGYRFVALLGAQFRLVLLLALRALARLRPGRDPAEITASLQKYLTIVQWTLGLRKPVIPR